MTDPDEITAGYLCKIFLDLMIRAESNPVACKMALPYIYSLIEESESLREQDPGDEIEIIEGKLTRKFHSLLATIVTKAEQQEQNGVVVPINTGSKNNQVN